MNRWNGHGWKSGILLALGCACSSHPAVENAHAPLPSATSSTVSTPSNSARADPSAPAPHSSAQAAGSASGGGAAAAADGSTAAPSAGKMCGGIAGIRCPEKQYCAFPIEAQCGAGDMAGVCKPIPEICTMEYAPVCGCDGKTYGSSCVAARGGISIVKRGACEAATSGAIPDGKTCGTRGVPGNCSEGSYCAFKDQCGNTDAGGTCTKKPQICNHLMAPVCGCDGKTYANGCHAAREGVSVAAPGACKTPGN